MSSAAVTRIRGLTSTVLFGAVVLAGVACEPGQPTGPVGTPSFASSSSLPHTINTTLPIPANVYADFAAYDCSNNTGPYITFSGLTVLDGFGTRLAFTNNLKGTHTASFEGSVAGVTLPAGTEIVIPKQPVRGGVGGNPHIWVQFTDSDGDAVSEEIYIGRCVQGASWKVDRPLTTPGSAWTEFVVTSCENKGPFIEFQGGLALAGLNARIIFRNADNKVGGPHKASTSISDHVVIPDGQSYTFPKQPSRGGVGGNPWIFAGFTDGDLNDLGELTLIGRCEQLSKAL